MFPLGPPSGSTGIGVAGTGARAISKITGHLVALTGIGAAPVTQVHAASLRFCSAAAKPRRHAAALQHGSVCDAASIGALRLKPHLTAESVEGLCLEVGVRP